MSNLFSNLFQHGKWFDFSGLLYKNGQIQKIPAEKYQKYFPALRTNQCDRKKLPNVYKSCPKMILLEKLKILTT